MQFRALRLGLIVIVCISGLLVPKVISSTLLQVFDQDSIQGSGRVVYRESMLIFKADFEEGTYYDVVDNDVGHGGHARVDWGGSVVTGTGSVVQTGDAKLSVQSAIVYNGDYASRHEFLSATTDGRAEVARWKEPRNDGGYDELYYGVAYFLPTSFTAQSGIIILQLAEGQNPATGYYNYQAVLHISNRDIGQVFRISKTNDAVRGIRLWEDTKPIPTKGEWHTLIFHAKYTANGFLKFYVDDELRATINGDFRLNDGYDACHLQLDLYGSTSSAQYVVFDEMRIATTYDEARPIRGGDVL